MTITRRPRQIVELVQRRCGLRFGVAPCTATGTPCHQLWGSCGDRDHIDQAGLLVWRFCKPGDQVEPLYSRTGEEIYTNAIPLLASVTTSSAEINVGSQRTGVAPLGIGAGASVTFLNAPWDDHVGDYYLADRPSIQGTFWGKWRARNLFFSDMMLRIYEGYVGQALEDMQRRDYYVDGTPSITTEQTTLKGISPLDWLSAKNAKFPPETVMSLATDINTSTAAVRIYGNAVDLALNLGNTGSKRYLRIGSEILLYTGWTDAGGGYFDLTGVQRAQLASTLESHTAQDGCQRVGRYENIQHWRVAADLIDNQSPIPIIYRDSAQWDDEGYDHMITVKATRTVISPVAVDTLLGELCQQGGFSIWWDERLQRIPLLANRPPNQTPLVLNEETGIIMDGAQISDDPDLQISRVAVYYYSRSPFNAGKPENYKVLHLEIDGYVEAPAASGKVKTLTIFADWITRDTDATRLAARVLLRYRLIPQYLTLAVDAKDRQLQLGREFDIVLGAIEDAQGNPLSSRWQVISANETVSGHQMRLKFQSYRFLGRFAVIMPTAAPDYDAATPEEQASGCWMAEATTECMPNGDDPYLLQ
jgi:hypothetical protein